MIIASRRDRSHRILRYPFRSLPKTGQTLVEFALVVPLLLTIVFGIIEFGVLFSVYVGLTNGAREGARAGSTFQYDCPTTTPNCRVNRTVSSLRADVDTDRQTRILEAVNATLNPLIVRSRLSTVITYTPDNSTSSYRYGEKVTVRLTYQHRLFFNLLGTPTLTMRARSTMRIEPGGR